MTPQQINAALSSLQPPSCTNLPPHDLFPDLFPFPLPPKSELIKLKKWLQEKNEENPLLEGQGFSSIRDFEHHYAFSWEGKYVICLSVDINRKKMETQQRQTHEKRIETQQRQKKYEKKMETLQQQKQEKKTEAQQRQQQKKKSVLLFVERQGDPRFAALRLTK